MKSARNRLILMLSTGGLCFSLLLSGPGCVSTPVGIATIEGKEQDDIPVPKDYELERSYAPAAAEEASFRSWHGYYRGFGEIGELAPWYVAAMRERGWEFKGMETPRGKRTLHFTKGDESARIQLDRELNAKAATYINIVHAEIHPRGPEDATLEENLKLLEEGVIKPASYSPKGAESESSRGVTDEKRVNAGKASGAAAPRKKSGGTASAGAARPAATTDLPPLEEINQFEERTTK